MNTAWTFTPDAIASNTPAACRARIRAGDYTGHTSGMAPGYAQGNVVILPSDLAGDFLRFCQLNPKPCPLLGVSGVGEYILDRVGNGIDIRTDVPRYRVWNKGELVAEPTDIRDLWRDDLVTFVIGCSFSFEQALIESGVALRHIDQARNVAMYKTNIECTPAGPFHGPMVVSMRPLSPDKAIRAVQVTSRMPNVHGAPVHLGFPADIGITDITKPDFGEAVEVKPGELEVFWACGVTPQAVVMAAKPEFCITHAPGCMLITDLKNRDLETA